MRFRISTVAAVVASTFGLSASLDAAPKVGVAAAVKNDVSGTQAGSTRALSTGSNVFQEELIRTGTASDAQLLFLDQTTLSVGPQSEVTLDRFIYDPSSGSGDVLLRATRGAFRFISGTQNPLNYRIETPSATIGVRGTIVSCTLGSLICKIEEGAAVFEFGSGAVRVNAGNSIRINDDGSYSRYPTGDDFSDLTRGWTFEVEDESAFRVDYLFERELIEEEDEPQDPCDFFNEGCGCDQVEC